MMSGQTILHRIALGRPKTRRAAELLRMVHAHQGDLEERDDEGQPLGLVFICFLLAKEGLRAGGHGL